MRMRNLLLMSLLLLFSFSMVAGVQAANNKYTFNDVNIDGMIVEIEAGVKSVNKGDFSTCSYYSDDYMEYLGYYEAAVFAGDTEAEVLGFCVAHFDERVQ